MNSNVPEWLAHIIDWLLAKSLDDRIQTADHVATLFEQCLAHVQQPTIIELPEECRPLVRASNSAITSWHIGAAMIGVGCLAIAGVYSVSHSILDRPELNPTSESFSSSSIDESTPTWNDMQSEIEAFEKDLQPAEEEMEELWRTK